MFKGIIYFIKFSWKSDKFYIIFRLLCEIINVSISIASIIMPKYILDELFGAKRLQYVVIYLSILLGFNLLGGLISNFLKTQSENRKEIVRTKFELYMAEKLMVCDYNRIEDPFFHDLREKANNYIGGQWNNFGEVMELSFKTFGQLLLLLTVFYLIITLHFVILLLFLLLITFNSIVISIYKKKSASLQMEEIPPALRRRRYFEDMTKDCEYAKEIRINGITSWILEKYKHYMELFCLTTLKIHKNNLMTRNFVAMTNVIQQAISYGYLVYEALLNHLSIGQFTMYINAIGVFNRAMNEIMDNVMSIARYSTYYEAFDRYVSLPVNTRKGRISFNCSSTDSYEIEFVNVSFKYPGQNKYALENISVKINPREKVAIVGENGSGKTTFVKLMTRLYDPTEGKILLNGIDIRDIKYEDYMSIFSVVFQDFTLFAFTIKENIILKENESVTDERALQIAKSIGISEKLLGTKDGIGAQVYKHFDENGVVPSGGEAQKIAISRALYKNAPIVVLDEPTAALDPRAEYEIYKNFDKLTGNKTSIYISHRLSSCRICDTILVFKNGEIIERGSHNNLTNQNSLYRDMFNKQAIYFND